MAEKGKILILTDGKAGHENQSKAFARALGREADLLEVHFVSKRAKAASYLFDRFDIRALGLLTVGRADVTNAPSLADELERLKGCGYAAVLGAGSGTFYAVKSVAGKLGVASGVVLYPRGYRIATFDCILAPEFDRPRRAKNVVVIPANLVANDASFYEKGVQAFEEHYRKVNGCARDPSADAVAVIVGGPNKCSTLCADWMTRELKKLFAANPDKTLWVTTSRRTPRDVEAAVDAFPFAYKLLYSKDHFNPIPAFVRLAKRLYVTAESTGMLSEACTFGSAEVIALDNLNPGPHKFRRFVENLRRDGYVEGSRKIDLSAPFAAARRLMRL